MNKSFTYFEPSPAPKHFPLDRRPSTKTYTLFFSKRFQEVNDTIMHKLLQLSEGHLIWILGTCSCAQLTDYVDNSR